MPDPFFHLYEQHASEAAFIWLLWQNACGQPQHNKQSLIELEKRVFNHIAGLMVSPDTGWEFCNNNLSFEEAGETFASSQLAFRTYSVERVKAVATVASRNEDARAGFVSAMEWLPNDICHPWIKKFLESKDLDHKAMALEVCIARGDNPGKYLNLILHREDCISHKALHNTALKCVGVFKRKDLLEYCQNQDLSKKFWALYACVMLGDMAQLEYLKPFVCEPGTMQNTAIQLAFRSLPLDIARTWISDVAKIPNSKRQVIMATGVLGDPHALQWLVGVMQDPTLARVAGEAFCQITGAVISETALEAQPSFTLDELIEKDGIELDEDEHLAWPNPLAVAQYWKTEFSDKLIPGKRYFLGNLIQKEKLIDIVKNGCQRQRMYAAYELAIQSVDQPLINICCRQTQRA